METNVESFALDKGVQMVWSKSFQRRSFVEGEKGGGDTVQINEKQAEVYSTSPVLQRNQSPGLNVKETHPASIFQAGSKVH